MLPWRIELILIRHVADFLETTLAFARTDVSAETRLTDLNALVSCRSVQLL